MIVAKNMADSRTANKYPEAILKRSSNTVVATRIAQPKQNIHMYAYPLCKADGLTTSAPLMINQKIVKFNVSIIVHLKGVSRRTGSFTKRTNIAAIREPNHGALTRHNGCCIQSTG